MQDSLLYIILALIGIVIYLFEIAAKTENVEKFVDHSKQLKN